MKYSDIPNYVKEISTYLHTIKNLSEGTVTDIIETMKQFLTFYNLYRLNNEYKAIVDIPEDEIRNLIQSDFYGYIFYLEQNKYSEGTISVRVNNLRTYFKYLHDIKHYLFKFPMKNVKVNFKNRVKIPNFLSEAQARTLLEHYANSDNPLDIRNNAIFHIFLLNGLRISELRNMKISDIRFDVKKFTIVGKGNKERTAYLNDSTIEAIKKYLEVRKNFKINKGYEDYLFISCNHQRMGVQTIRDLVKKTYKEVGIDTYKHSVHTLRHTFATILYRATSDLRLLQELLGHTNINTTAIYTHTYDADVNGLVQNGPFSKFMFDDALHYATAE